MIESVDELKQILLSRIVKVDGPRDTQCWIWTWGQNGCGYGRVKWRQVNYTAHRLSYEVFVGPIPTELPDINHHCDNKLCIRPEHLYAGTKADNADDRDRRGRYRCPRTTGAGEANGAAVLSETKAGEILYLLQEGYLTQREIADLYGISKSRVSEIKLGLGWGHVKPIEPPPPPPIVGTFRRRM